MVNALKLQSFCYHEICARFGLSSNLAQQVCRRVAGPPKVAKQKHRPVKAVKAGFVTYIDWAVGNTAWRLLVILNEVAGGLLKGFWKARAVLRKPSASGRRYENTVF
ncbi:MAG: hypothetical protein Q6L60_10245 [Thermostichus sp. HHBFW_bins_43]